MIKNTKKFTALLALALSTGIYFNAYASDYEPIKTRIWGMNRYETSANISKEGWSCSYYAIITSGENFPDSLSAVTLSRKYDAPILLTNKNRLNSNAKKELQRMNVKKVLIIGGNGAISNATESAIKLLGINTERIWGKDRYETSIKIAERLGDPNCLFVVTGSRYEDALSVGPIAAKKAYPVVLTTKDYIPNCVKAYLKNKKFSKIYLVGDEKVISDNVAREFENYIDNYEGSVERIPADIKDNGKVYDAYERNLNIVSKFRDEFNDYKNIYMASGSEFADALSINGLAAKKEAPIIMVNTRDNNMLKSFISNIYLQIGNINIVGGQGSISDSYLNNLVNYIDDKEVIFNDENLDKAVREKLGIKNSNKRIYKSQLKNVKTLDVSGYNISDISGIDKFENLQELNLNKNKIHDLSPLEHMTTLENLNLSTNDIENIEPLKKLYSLRYINLSNNRIRKISYLDDIRGLRHINLNNNEIDYLPNFDNLRILNYLDLSNNHGLGSASKLEDLRNLKVLKLRNVGISSISFLEKLTDLEELDLSKNSITNLDDMKKLQNLKKLYLNDNSIRNIKPLKELKSLEELNVWGNSIDNVKEFKKFKRFKKLTIEKGLLDKDDKKELDTIYNIDHIYDEKDTYLEDVASYSKYDNKTDNNHNVTMETEYEDNEYDEFKQNMYQFELLYGHEYNPSEVLYHPYLDYKYPSTARELLSKEKELTNLMNNENYSPEVRKMLRIDFQNTIDSYNIVRKNHDMNEEIKSLEAELKMCNEEKQKRKVRNKINYIYSDYRCDFYKNAVCLCEKEIKNLTAQINELNFKSGYSNNERIRKIQGEIANKNLEYTILKENKNKYSNYRNFFAVVDSFLDE